MELWEPGVLGAHSARQPGLHPHGQSVLDQAVKTLTPPLLHTPCYLPTTPGMPHTFLSSAFACTAFLPRPETRRTPFLLYLCRCYPLRELCPVYPKPDITIGSGGLWVTHCGLPPPGVCYTEATDVSLSVSLEQSSQGQGILSALVSPACTEDE